MRERMSNTSESQEHRRLVKSLIDYLNNNGFKVTHAAYDGYPVCEPIDERVPDVIAINVQELIAIGEAKTCDDLDNERTNDQFKIFSNRKMSSGASKGSVCPFYVVVPKSCTDALHKNLATLGLSNKSNIITLQQN